MTWTQLLVALGVWCLILAMKRDAVFGLAIVLLILATIVGSWG